MYGSRNNGLAPLRHQVMVALLQQWAAVSLQHIREQQEVFVHSSSSVTVLMC